jgi:curved DNA-binding protein CbpA
MEPYQILGVASHATVQEIKRAFRNLAKRCHPDTSGYDSAEHFMLVQGAYETLIARLPLRNTQAQAPSAYKANPTTSKTSWSVEDEKKWRGRHPDAQKARTPEERATEEKVARKREKAQAAYARRKKAAAEKASAERVEANARAEAAKRAADLRWKIGDRLTDESGRIFVKVDSSSWKQVV